MNQTNQEQSAITVYQIGILALLISVIFFIFSYLGVGFTTNDDTRYQILAYLAPMGIQQSRIASFIGYQLHAFPHWISKILKIDLLNFINLLAIAVNVALFSWNIYKITQQRLFAIFVAVFFFAAIQNSWEHNVLTSYTFMMNVQISLLLISLNLFLEYLFSKQAIIQVLSPLIFLFMLFASYEFSFLYVAIFVFIAFYNAQITATSNRAAILPTLYTSSLHLIAVIIFLTAYVSIRWLYPTSYSGVKVAAQFSLFKVLQVIYQYTVASFPTYIYFHYSSLFNTYSEITQGHSYTIVNFIAQLKAEWLVKSIVVSYFVYLLLHHHLIALSNKMFMGLLVVSVYAMLVPNILVALTDKYQQWVTIHGSLQYVTTYFSYFGTVLLIVSAIVFFNQFFHSSDTLTITILRRLYVYLITIAIAFMSLVTDYSNYYVFKEQKISQQKWVVLDALVQSGNLDSVAAGSFIYAPSLWNKRAIVANFSNYWTSYLTLKYKKAVTVSNSAEKLKARLANQSVNNLYYLKFSQEPKDMQQFILFAKVHKVVNDIIFLASDAVIVSNSNRKNFLVFGRSLPINADAPLNPNAAVLVDDGAVQRDGNFFSARVDKQQVNERYTATHIKTVGETGVDLESVSISSYTDQKLRQFDRSACFKLGVVFNLNKLSSLSCDLKSIFPIGWNGLEGWRMWSTANAEMQIDLPKDCQGENNTCDLKLSLMGIFHASAAQPKKVLAKINGQAVGEWSITGEQTISIPLDSKTLQGKLKNIKIQFSIPDAVSPAQFGRGDSRMLGISLSAYQLIKRNGN